MLHVDPHQRLTAPQVPSEISSDGLKEYVLSGAILSNRILFQWFPGSSSPLDR